MVFEVFMLSGLLVAAALARAFKIKTMCDLDIMKKKRRIKC
jgi:predicted hydrolase (HD superfamily)